MDERASHPLFVEIDKRRVKKANDELPVSSSSGLMKKPHRGEAYCKTQESTECHHNPERRQSQHGLPLFIKRKKLIECHHCFVIFPNVTKG